jgi:hypothetical protein
MAGQQIAIASAITHNTGEELDAGNFIESLCGYYKGVIRMTTQWVGA